jgi:hypothetical protein
MKRAPLAILTSAALFLAGACSNLDSPVASEAATGQPRFENGGMAGSGGRSTLPSDSTDSRPSSVSAAGTPSDEADALNGGMAGSGGL